MHTSTEYFSHSNASRGHAGASFPRIDRSPLGGRDGWVQVDSLTQRVNRQKFKSVLVVSLAPTGTSSVYTFSRPAGAHASSRGEINACALRFESIRPNGRTNGAHVARFFTTALPVRASLMVIRLPTLP